MHERSRIDIRSARLDRQQQVGFGHRLVVDATGYRLESRPFKVIPTDTLAPRALAGLIRLVDQGTVSSSIAKEVFAKMFDSGRSAEEIVAAEGLAQIGDESALGAIVREVLERHADAAAQYRATGLTFEYRMSPTKPQAPGPAARYSAAPVCSIAAPKAVMPAIKISSRQSIAP